MFHEVIEGQETISFGCPSLSEGEKSAEVSVGLSIHGIDEKRKPGGVRQYQAATDENRDSCFLCGATARSSCSSPLWSAMATA